MTSVGATAAQTRATNDAATAAVRIDEPRAARCATDVAPPIIDSIEDGGFTADILMHLDPWDVLAANSAYKNCPKETGELSCYARCACGLAENLKKCDGTRACEQLAGAEKRACDTHCLTDY
jgi:hypothetical protein